MPEPDARAPQVLLEHSRTHEDFDGLIERYSLVTHQGRATSPYDLLPKTRFQLVFTFSDSGANAAFLVGPSTSMRHVPRDDFFVVRFRPGRLAHIADVAPADLLDRSVPLARVLREDAAGLGERLARAPGLAGKQAVMADLFRGARVRGVPRDPLFLRAIDVLEAAKGCVSVSDLASLLGTHVRKLERLFDAHVGSSPKRLARVIRFQRAMNALRAASGRSTMAELAAACGYADQSHLVREFQALTARPPGRFLPR
jgi:AraC-like DNA-binding protein